MSTNTAVASATTHRVWFRRVYGLLDTARSALLVGLLCAFGGTVILVATPKITQRIVDESIVGRDGNLRSGLLLFLALAVVRSILTFGRRILVGRVSIEFEANARLLVYARLRTLDRAGLERFPPGQVVSRANGDISSISQVLAFAPFVLANALQVVLSLLAMLTISVRLTLVGSLMVPLLVLVAKPARRKQFAASFDVQQRQGELAAFADETIGGVRVIKGFGRERDAVSKFESLCRSLYGSRLRNVRIAASVTPVLQLIPQLSVVLLLIVGGRMAIDESLSVGAFIAFATYLTQLVGPIRTSAILLTVLEAARAGATRVFELLDTEPMITNPAVAAKSIRDTDSGLAGDGYETTNAGAPGPTGGAAVLAVKELCVAFDEQVVLSNISFVLTPGETLGITGRSGSGKSVLALSLARFIDPHSGAVRIDGVDLRNLPLDTVRATVGIVFDEAFLFSRSVRENLTLGRPDASESEIREAALLAEANEFIEALPHGYETVVGEQGLTLSGGQRQRLALARALLTNPPILILDDATSALDVLTEQRVLRNIARVREGRSTIVVAQRRSSIAIVDRVALLDGGHLVDLGTVGELEQRSPEFVALLSERRPTDDDLPPGFVSQPRLHDAPPLPAGPMRGQGFGAGGIGANSGGGFGGPSPTFAAAAMGSAEIKLPDIRDVPIETASAAIDAAMVPIAPVAHGARSTGLREAILRQRPLLALSLLLVLLESGAAVIGPLFVRRGLDLGVAQSDRGALDRSALLFFVALVGALITAYCSALVVGLLGERMLYRLRLRVFGHLQRLGLDFYERELSGRLLTRVTGDVDSLGNVLQQGVVSLVVNVVTFVVLAVFLLRSNASLGMWVILTFPPLILATVRFRTVSARAYELVRDRVSTVNAELAETFAGVRVVQSVGGRDRSGERFHAAVAAHRETRMLAQKQTSLYFPFVEFISAVGTLIVLGAGAKYVRSGELSQGALTAFLLAVTQLFGPIQQLTVVLDTWQQAGAALAKLRGFFDEKPTVADIPESSHLHTVDDDRRGPPSIELRNVTFRYRGASREALTSVNLSIAAGETVALVGSTGAGKSTVMKLIPRFYDPTEGIVLIDGVDLRTLPMDSWRRRIGIVVQENALFTGTIGENVAFARPNASRVEIEAALRLVGAGAMVDQGMGIDTPVARRGASLSAGQRQLLALARAAIVEPGVLLLDEATANLDLDTEAEVQRAMGVLAHNRTTIVIAHRLETARRADRIVVIEGGEVVETGSHDELLAHKGRYAALWRV